MHKVLLLPLYFSAPPEPFLLELHHDIAFRVESPLRAGTPFAAAQEPALRTECNAVIVQSVLLRIDVNGRTV